MSQDSGALFTGQIQVILKGNTVLRDHAGLIHAKDVD